MPLKDGVLYRCHIDIVPMSPLLDGEMALEVEDRYGSVIALHPSRAFTGTQVRLVSKEIDGVESVSVFLEELDAQVQCSESSEAGDM